MYNVMGERIREMRIKNGLTMRDMGSMLNVGASAVNKWEKGHVTNLGIETVNKIAQVLNCSATWLMGYDDAITEDELELIKKYRNADDVVREAIKRLLGWKGEKNE
jgi:transcriptional regulator with XRE-family HTH domain